MTERPDLFAAVIPVVGVLDAVRAETTANGVPNIPEFGIVAREDEFRALLAMSSYHHVKDATAYPAVLLIHGVNDPRVNVWHSSKMAARLLAASTSGKPVLLNLDYEAGHGVGATRLQRQRNMADPLADGSPAVPAALTGGNAMKKPIALLAVLACGCAVQHRGRSDRLDRREPNLEPEYTQIQAIPRTA